MREALTPELVIDAAVVMVERDGAAQLTMRKLAAELGVSANTIYWHVGGREQVLDAVIRRVGARLGEVEVEGRTPRDRIMSVARHIWTDLLANQQVSALAHDRGHTTTLNLQLQLLLAREVTAAGLTGAEAARAMRGILYAVGGLIVIAFREQERMLPDRTPEATWAAVDDPAVDPGLVAALSKPPDLDELFEHTIGALVEAVIPV